MHQYVIRSWGIKSIEKFHLGEGMDTELNVIHFTLPVKSLE